jgi:prepilin-type N-terminal cleavage/methylation domain-containing protein
VAEQLTNQDRPRGDRDGGFTLIETLIVVVIMGMIVTVTAGALIVVLRNAPSTEVRAEDARSVQGLVTWLPQDIDAAPPDGFNRAHGYWPCGDAAPAGASYNIVTAEWTERTTDDHNFAATYRYEQVNTEWRMVRYTCNNGGSGAMGASERMNLTSALPAWDPASPPARVSMCKAFVNAGATCPAGQEVLDSETAPDEVHSLKLHIERIDGVVATIDAAPKNPDQDLADDPNASMNFDPTVLRTNYVLPMKSGETVTIDVTDPLIHGASDPDGDPISIAIDSTEPMPAGITATTTDPTLLNVTADPTLGPGPVALPIIVIVSDNHAGWLDVTVVVEIVSEPNDPPQATIGTNYSLSITQGTSIVLPLDATHGLMDPNGDTMHVTVLTKPVAMDTTPPKTDPAMPIDLEVKVPGGAPVGPTALPIALLVDDGRGGSITLTIDVTIVASTTPNQSPVATTPNVTIDLYPGDVYSFSVTSLHGVSDPDFDPISIVGFDPIGGLATTLDGPLDVTVTADPTLAVGTLAPIRFGVEDPDGAAVDVFLTVNVLEIPPSPSDCVLHSLSASPSSVARHANGSQAHQLAQDVTVTVTYSGTCDGLALKYDSGDTSGLGFGTGRVFPLGSPSSVVIVGKNNAGTERWLPGNHTLSATTTSDVAVKTITTNLSVS